MDGADEQARLAFGVTLYDFQSVILVAACGEWWTFKGWSETGLIGCFEWLARQW